MSKLSHSGRPVQSGNGVVVSKRVRGVVVHRCHHCNHIENPSDIAGLDKAKIY